MKTAPSSLVLLCWLLAVGEARALIGPAFQAQLGAPSTATTDPANRANYLIERPQYVLGYNDTTREPNWVSWDFTTGDRGAVERSDAFAADPLLPAGFVALDQNAYRNSGYDRGHMCPSADRTLTLADNQATFYMTNIVPQTPDNNQGPWARFEDECRRLADLGNELLIVSGPGGSAGGPLPSGAAIPAYTWKVAVVVPNGPGPALGRITEATRIIALKVPNIAGIRTTPWQNFITSAADIESSTGYTFFRALPPPLAAVLRAKVDGQSSVEPPVLTRQPGNVTALVGATATLFVTASGIPAPGFQWHKQGTPVAGATGATLTLGNVAPGDAGSYSVVITNEAGSVTSNPATLRVITRSFAGIYFGRLGSGPLTGNMGSCALLIQSDNTGIFLAHEDFNARAHVSHRVIIDDGGGFRFPLSPGFDYVQVEGSIADDGTVTGRATAPLPPPTIAFAGWTLVAYKSADTGPASALAGYYQAEAAEKATTLHAIVGSSGRIFLVVQTSDSATDGTGQVDGAGQFTLAAGSQTIAGTISAPSLNLTAVATTATREATTFSGFASHATATPGQRMLNLSTRTSVGTGDQVAIVGFVVKGLESKSVLIRGIGPALRDFGVASAVGAPRLELFRNGSPLPFALNNGWSTALNRATIADAAAQVGAFPLAVGSGDSAIVARLAPGEYSALVSAADGRAGVGLVEVYDLSDASAWQRLANLSTRASVGAGESTLITGVVVTGTAPKRLLIRAAGPALAQFGVAGALARPQLTLLNGDRVIMQNAGWTSPPGEYDIIDATVRAGAFAFAPDSVDAAIAINLAPGAYTAQVTGVGGTTGIALVEVYEVP